MSDFDDDSTYVRPDIPSEDDQEPATADVPSPQAASPPSPVVEEVVEAENKGDAPSDSDADEPARAASPVVPAAPVRTAAPAKVVTPSAAPATVCGSDTCPMVCSPGLQKLWQWMQFKPVLPGALILGTTVGYYIAHTMFGFNCVSLLCFVALLAVVLGGLVQVHNFYMDPKMPIPSVKISKDTATQLGTHVSLAIEGVMNYIDAAVSWKCPMKSAVAAAHIWLLYRFNWILTNPTIITLDIVLLFAFPTVFAMVRPQVTAVYTASVKPILNQVIMKAHVLAAPLAKVAALPAYMTAGGAVASILVFWWLFSSWVSICCILSCLATTSSITLLAFEHRKCIAGCFGGASCPGVAKAKTA